MFSVDPKLQEDTFVLGSLELSELLIMNDARYPWLVLVPRVESATELIHLFWADQTTLLAEINMVSRLLRTVFSAHKINVASLGNVVAQLHVHCIARQEDDACWPQPVWGQLPAEPYSEKALAVRAKLIIDAIHEEGVLDFTSHPSYS